MGGIMLVREKQKSHLRLGFVLKAVAVLLTLELTRELQQGAPGRVAVLAFLLTIPALVFATYASRVINPFRVLRSNFYAYLALFLVNQVLLGQAITSHGLK